jgi:transporter family protein
MEATGKSFYGIFKFLKNIYNKIMWIFYAFGSALFAALVAILGKVGLEKLDSTLATTVRAIIMAVFLFVIAIVIGKFRGFSIHNFFSKAWMYVALSGLAGALSWLCYFFALKYGPTTPVAAIDKLSIVFVAILATLFLSEGISLYKFAGVILIASGAFLTIVK